MVAIKDFGLPSCCANCDFDALNKCLLTGQFIKGDRLVNGEDKRLDDCPLVPLPEINDCMEKLEDIEGIINYEDYGDSSAWDKLTAIREVLENE